MLTGENACQMSRKRRDRPHHEKNNDTRGNNLNVVFQNKKCGGSELETPTLTFLSSTICMKSTIGTPYMKM